jgi:protein TonB
MRQPFRFAPLLLSALMLCGCEKAPTKSKPAQSVRLLPDTPPPPPPPKQEEKRPEPRKEDKPQQQLAQPKQVPAPEQQALKSDEAAGQGPGNGMTAGAVTKDYTDGQIGTGSTASGAGGASRLIFNNYAQTTTRALNDHLLRERGLRLSDYRLVVHVWLQADGRLLRAELAGSTGDTQLDASLREAMQRFPGSLSPLPDRMPQPLRLRVSNRMIG